MCSVMRCLLLIMLATVLATGPAHAGAAGPRVIREQLKTEFTLSRMPVFGCTELVFRFDPAVLERGDLAMVMVQIDKWLARAPARAAAMTPGSHDA